MAKSSSTMSDPAFLEAALEGLQLQKERIEKQMREVLGLLGKSSGRKLSAETDPTPRKSVAAPKRQLSDTARRKIAAAQKKRWAEYRKKDKQIKET